MIKDHYTFGDSATAAERLGHLARAYEHSTARLLAEARGNDVAPATRALDLGCGPGHTTELVHEVIGARETWGVDVSPALIEHGRARATPTIHYMVHDVTITPFPVSDVDFAYARYLLNHVASPHSVLLACALAMRRGGQFVIEENCALESADALFVDYYERVALMQRHYGQDMFIGAQLPSLAAGTGFFVQRFERTRLVLEARTMALLHAMNLHTWSHDPFALMAFDARELAEMTRDFERIATGQREATPVLCTMGQAILRK
jgi:trans-aconitate 2-methyltransferase